MRKFPVVIDVETKYTFREFDDPKKLGVTVAAIYDYKKKNALVFLESELNQLFPLLENASYIIGFNNRSFDIPVLAPYYPGRIEAFSIFDILEDIKIKIGKRISLNELVLATLNKKKTGHGLQAINFYHEKRWQELKDYCLKDVLLTKELFEFGVKNGEIYYLNEKGKVTIKVDWKKYFESSGKNESPLTLPF
ncbi:MAG: helicase [Microgenomates group bacterium]|nr:helicase [Microgenomates group bacterium]